MAATYFSSSERRLDRGFGLAAAFLEHSANFRSINEKKKKKKKSDFLNNF